MGDRRIVVAMSGGVDSTVAAYLLHREGWEIIGVTGKFLDDSAVDTSGQCCTAESARDARQACDLLDSTHITSNMVDEFRREVLERFFGSYKRGSTPNPCVDCNRFIKFDVFWKLAAAADSEMLGTGHYSRIKKDSDGEWRLLRGIDREKDQSYFLAVIPRDQLPRIKFPVGDYTKEEVRKMALEFGFRNAERKESQDICFTREGFGFDDLARLHGVEVSAPKRGPILDEEGALRGEHRGIEYFTLGQRRGLAVGMGEPKFVYAIEPETNTLKVGPRDFNPVSRVVLRECNWIAPDLLDRSEEFDWLLRYRSKPIKAALDIDAGGDGAVLGLDSSGYFVAPGQWAVAYLGDIVVGCGEIARAD